MSKYSHPLQAQYSQKVTTILQNQLQPHVSVNNFIKLLSQNQIKFFSRDDLTKFTKLSNPFDTISVREAFTYLQFISVNFSLECKYFIVKFTGRSLKSLNLKPIVVKKVCHSHPIELCINDFRKKMMKLYGRESFWYRALGGISGCNFIKRQIFCKRVSRLFCNTCHSTCLENFLKFITNQDPQADILWSDFRFKIDYVGYKAVTISNQPEQVLYQQQVETNQDQKQPLSTQQLQHPQKSLLLLQNRSKPLSASQQLKPSQPTIETIQQKKISRNKRLKTLDGKPRIAISIQSWNLQLAQAQRQNQCVTIHSKNRYRIGGGIGGDIKKCRSMMNKYQF